MPCRHVYELSRATGSLMASRRKDQSSINLTEDPLRRRLTTVAVGGRDGQDNCRCGLRQGRLGPISHRTMANRLLVHHRSPMCGNQPRGERRGSAHAPDLHVDAVGLGGASFIEVPPQSVMCPPAGVRSRFIGGHTDAGCDVESVGAVADGDEVHPDRVVADGFDDGTGSLENRAQQRA